MEGLTNQEGRKKGLFARMIDRLDKKMQEKAKTKSCCCNEKKAGKKSCCS
ncbi:MAG: hypothetical protein PHT50_05985 [Candidatus Omnitrophica bacterium]|nr:hypothetical protein [Candidatus Omnitrophota bacterium]